jgi:hypothetical protein
MDTKFAADFEKLKNDGNPKFIQIKNYWKYKFTIIGATDHYSFQLTCGGTPNDIYRFKPYGGWTEWEYAGITDLEYKQR